MKRSPTRQTIEGRIPLTQFLALLMPLARPAMRRKHFHSYLVDEIQRVAALSNSRHSEAEAERIARVNEEQFKRDGFLGSTSFIHYFLQWRKERLSRIRAAAGRTGKAQQMTRRKKCIEAKKRKRKKPELIYVGDEAELDSLANPSHKHFARLK